MIKYGSPIGTASAVIAAGAHVHTHNVASSRGRGDLDVPQRRPASRGSPSRPTTRPTRNNGTPSRAVNR